MVLQQQVVPLLFNKGLDTKSDDLTSDTFLLLENAYQQKTNSIQQRNGVEYVPQVFTNPIKQIFTHDNSAFVHDTYVLNKYTGEPNSNYYQPSVKERLLQTVEVTRDGSNLPFTVTGSDTGTVDLTIVGSLEIYVFNNPITTTTFDYGVYQPISQTYITGATLNGNYAKCITMADTCYIFAIYLNQLGYYTIDSDGVTSGVFTAIDTVDSYSYEIRIGPLGICILYTVNPSGSRLAKICYLDITDTIIHSTVLTGADPVNGGFTLPVQPMCITDDGTHVYVCWLASVSGTQYKFYSGTLDATFNILNYGEFYTTINPSNFSPTAVQSFYEGFTGKLQYYVGYVKSDYSYSTIHNVSFPANVDSPLQDTTELLPSLNIFSRIFVENGHYYMFCIYDTWFGTSAAKTGFQATVFLVDVTNFGSQDKSYYFVGKCSYQIAWGFFRYWNLLATPVRNLNNGLGFRFPIKQKTNITGTTTNGISFDTITYPFTFDLSNNVKFNADSLNRELFISGGMLQMYDGQEVSENNFLLYPEIVSNTFDTGTGLVANGVYQYIGIFTYTDNLGNVHRSDVSNTWTVTFTSPPSTSAAYINVRAFIATNKRPSFSLYRTTNGGTIFYLITTVDYSVMTTEIFAVYDDNTDAVIVQNPLLYTTGGVLANYSTSSASMVHSFQNRLFLAGLEDPNSVLFSKEYVGGDGIGFAASNLITLDAKGGPIKAIHSMDDKFILFKKNSIFFTSGNGPDDTGNNGFFAIPQLVAGEIGCINKNSIARIPSGLMFQSAKGIYLLTRNLTTQYIGDNVEDYINPSPFFTANVVQATLNENVNQVIYSLSDGTSCVYDYYFDQWYIYNYPFISTQGTGLDNGRFVIADSSYMYIEGDGFLDVKSTGDVPYSQTIQTPWYAFAAIQGFQRFYSLLILGKYYSEHTLQISSYHDYQDFPTETVTITPDPTVNMTNGVYQFEYKPSRQKCEAIRFNITTTYVSDPLSGQDGNSFSASAISCTVGVKQSSNRMPANRRLT